MNPEAILDKAIELVKRANSVGVAVETALEAFKEKLFPTYAAAAGTDSAYGAIPAELQADIDAAVAACQSAA